jgi:hypothetical protein
MAMNCIDQEVTGNHAIYNGDACEFLADMPAGSIGFSVFSPPFADLYCYSDSERDLGNCKDYPTFFEHFSVIGKHLARIMQPGRIVAVHCIDIPAMKERDGYIGLKDFPAISSECFSNADSFTTRGTRYGKTR